MDDPFRHHPALRDKIIDPARSFFRDFNIESVRPVLVERGLPVDWWYSDDQREALRRRVLATRPCGDLWVFGYGSLMWDPGVYFTDCRCGHAPGHQRRFILKDVFGARGRPEAPGLMAALDEGSEGCNGLIFRIDEAEVEHETERLWRRELVAPGYEARFIAVDTDAEYVTALAFLADHDSDAIDAGLTRDEQVEYLVTGKGFLGTSLEYIENIAAHLTTLGIEDDELFDLLREARKRARDPA